MADITKIERMTTAEYMQKYPETEQLMELIEGEVCMSPAPHDDHQYISGELYSVIRAIVKQFAAGDIRYSPTDVHLDDYNIVQPDIFYVSNNNDRCNRTDAGYWHGAPDLVIEILSPGTSRRDRVDKFALYEKHGVREYWIVEPQGNFIEVYVLHEGKYQRQGAYKENESFTSTVVPQLTVQITNVFPVDAE
ncbi:MAG TPA: Uma2 family endonuclease [Aggregatilineales bacterium]|nr:Uma2 family endonuclease [Aggregatilineales bacterium]